EAKEETPLQRQLDRLGRQIGIAVLAAAGLIFLIGILREPDPSHVELLFLTAVGLAVAAIPEGLPAIVTISLAIGLQRMIRRHALVRKLLECAVLCNDAALKREKDRWIVEGDPTEGALLVTALRAGLDSEAARSQSPRVAEIAFTSERKKMSTLHAPLSEPDLREVLAVPEGERHRRLGSVGVTSYVKGAPERLVA